jgi:predicted GTPase
MDLSQAEEQDSQELLEAFLDLLEQKNDELPENILIFGRNGAGKSSLINTIHKVLTGKYFELAETGRGETQTLTMELER